MRTDLLLARFIAILMITFIIAGGAIAQDDDDDDDGERKGRRSWSRGGDDRGWRQQRQEWRGRRGDDDDDDDDDDGGRRRGRGGWWRQQQEQYRQYRQQQQYNDHAYREHYRQQREAYRQHRRQQMEAYRQHEYQQRAYRDQIRRQQQAYDYGWPQGQYGVPSWKDARRQQRQYERQYRDALKEQRRAERRAARDAWQYDGQYYAPYYQEQPQYYRNRSYQPVYRSYSNPGIFDYADVGAIFGRSERGGIDWKSLVLRTVLATVFNRGRNSYDNYDNNYYAAAPVYRSAPYREYTQYYDSTPILYRQASYAPAYSYDLGNSIPYEMLPLLAQTGLGDLTGGIAGEWLQRALGTGYYQGLLEGQAARRIGLGADDYYDPYAYNQDIYDPYSTSLGENRRYLSEGYELGYQDALRGRNDYANLGDGGEIDLVSLLLGSALSFRG